jgi:D-alanyl-D-alanine carboxypeptidase
MKRIVFLCFIFLVLSTTFATADRTVFFVLPEGNPLSKPSLDSNYYIHIHLQFASEMKVLWKAEIDGIVWYRCYNSDGYFYLPEMLVSEISDSVRLDYNGNIEIGYSAIDKDHPIPLSYIPGDLASVPHEYKAEGYEWRDMLLRKEPLKVYQRLIDHAEYDGVHIRILSAFRDAAYQSHLYARAIRRNGLFQNSVAKPGNSEHQLGTACDLTSNEIGSGLSKSFETTVAYQWLRYHAASYGIALSYPEHKVEITGYIYEPWHYRYMGKERWLAFNSKPKSFYTR